MDPKNWVMSNEIKWIYEWQPNSFANWEEGNTIIGPDGNLVVVNRIDESNFVKPLHDRAAIVSVHSPELITFNPETDIVDFPGGGKKFTIKYDGQSHKYWALVNPSLDVDVKRSHSGIYKAGMSGNYIRNTLTLISSPDLRTWTEEFVVISSNNPFFHGFQYTDWIIDGDDMAVVLRTAFEEERGLPTRQHDANFLSFLRIRNFRNAASSNETIYISTEELK